MGWETRKASSGEFALIEKNNMVRLLPAFLVVGIVILANVVLNGWIFPYDLISGENERLVPALARRALGRPYLYGGESPAGFDCSGLAWYVYRRTGRTIPRTVADQYDLLLPVPTPRRGDLVFFAIDGQTVSHVGIYTGEDRFIHATRTGGRVRIDTLQSSYWRERYRGARTSRKGAGRSTPEKVESQ